MLFSVNHFIRNSLNAYLFVLLLTFLPLSAGAEAFQAFLPLPSVPPIPNDNALSEEKVELGKQLFFDRRLSLNGKLSCNNCHDLMQAGEDGLSISTGTKGIGGKRNTPTLWNVAYQTVLFWDGRAANLESAIEEHLLDSKVMAMASPLQLSNRLKSIQGYARQFSAAFPDDMQASYKNIAKALATFIRTLTTPGSSFDHYLLGNKSAISAQAQRGFKQFIETGCASCHFWVNLSGPVPGLAFQMGEGFYELFPNYPGTDYETKYQLAKDLGRYLVTNDPTDKRMWRVPVLRNISQTAPYFHNGSVGSLEEAIKIMAETQLREELSERQVKDIKAFLETLSGEFPILTLPYLPE